jgi:hypothetical protein
MIHFPFLALIAFSIACSSERTCEDWASATCTYAKSVSNEPENVIESAELVVYFPRLSRTAAKNSSCEKQYPDPFPLADDVRCKHFQASSGNTVAEPKIEDLNGSRVYSCIGEDGTPLVSYTHGSKKATFNMSTEVHEQDCRISTDVDEY